jgi:membrane protein implicated in regulation of membrane protease activity
MNNPYVWVFGSMLLVGIVLMMISLVAGELGDVFSGGGDGDLTGDGLSWFSLTTLSIALVGFGVTGLSAVRFTQGWMSVLIGIVAAVLFVVVLRQFVLLPLMRQQSNSHLSEASYVGRTASVVLPISANGWGQVRFTDNNHAAVLSRARSLTGEELVAGTSVVIDAVNPDHVVVSPTTH